MHLIDTAWAVILPFSFFPFGVYLCYIFFSSTIPKDLLAAARVDGCSEWSVFRYIALPLARPVVALVAFFAFVADWNNYYLPFVMLSGSSKLPVHGRPRVPDRLDGGLQSRESGHRGAGGPSARARVGNPRCDRAGGDRLSLRSAHAGQGNARGRNQGVGVVATDAMSSAALGRTQPSDQWQRPAVAGDGPRPPQVPSAFWSPGPTGASARGRCASSSARALR